jgi:hypothetical protein
MLGFRERLTSWSTTSCWREAIATLLNSSFGKTDYLPNCRAGLLPTFITGGRLAVFLLDAHVPAGEKSGLNGRRFGFLDQTSERLIRWGAQSLPLNPRQFLELLRSLQNRFGPDSLDEENPLARDVDRLLRCNEAGFPSDWPDLEDYVVRAGMSIPRSARRNEMGGDTANIPWGPMEILAPPLIHSCRKMRGMAERKLVCGYTGAFRFPSRALLPAADGRAFTLRRLDYRTAELC